MKFFSTIILLAIAYVQVFAQKPVIDTSIYDKWPAFSDIHLSNNGKYLAYGIIDHKLNSYTTVVEATKGDWKKEFSHFDNGRFSADSRLFIYKTSKDSLCLLTLETHKLKYITHVKTWQLDDNSSWLFYKLDTPNNKLIVYNTTTGQQQLLENITACQFISGRSVILTKQEVSEKQTTLQWINLFSNETKSIWQGRAPGEMVFNKDTTKLLFTSRDSSKAKKQLWLYYKGEAKAIQLKIDTLDADHLSNFSFDHTGNKLFFTITQPVEKTKSNPALSSVDIYSYKDARLQSEQLQKHHSNSFACVFNFSTQQRVCLNKANEEIESEMDGDWILVKKDYDGNRDEWNWNKKSLRTIFVVSTKDGSRIQIAQNVPEPVCLSYQLSPSGKYVIYYNPAKKDYFSYEVATGLIADITKGKKAVWTYEDHNDWPDSAYEIPGNIVIGWAPNDQTVWLKSRNDIFRADPAGKLPLINLTNGYGIKHHITFNNTEIYSQYARVIDANKPLLMHLFNEDNKDAGFCRISVTRQKNPEFLSALPKSFYGIEAKSRDTNIYVLRMFNERSAPNYYLTKDFKTFTQLTDLQPQKAYNWLRAELVKWKTPDGNSTQGILYKPENFDPKKKYPIIFHYYERMSSGLHNFPVPQYQDGGHIDIATYVSNGYLVFLPDINYQVAYPGKSALNTILSAAKYLTKFSWADTKRMGLMGHSFGGFETNYIITHSHLFAAAVSMSGMTDFISAYGSIIGDGTSRQRQYELYRDRIGATLWQRPDLYIENSPVLKADKVTTPVLLMANKKDDDVPYEQGFEFFTALRRLGKKAWLLQYDNGGHQVESEKDKKDLTIRTRQFFDYYLMGKTPPKWMIDGIPASQKQIDDGLAVDFRSDAKP